MDKLNRVSAEPVTDLRTEKMKLGINCAAEKLYVKMKPSGYCAQKLWPTMDSLRKLGKNVYLVDYQYDYDIEDLIAHGASSATELLSCLKIHSS